MKPGTIGALTGIAAGYAQMRRLTFDEAVAEVCEYLAQVPKQERQKALDEAAAVYVGDHDPDGVGYWHPDALEVLIRAGADRAAAEAIRVKRSGAGLGALGMLAAETAPER